MVLYFEFKVIVFYKIQIVRWSLKVAHNLSGIGLVGHLENVSS